MSGIISSFAEFKYRILWKKSVLSYKHESGDDCQNVVKFGKVNQPYDHESHNDLL